MNSRAGGQGGYELSLKPAQFFEAFEGSIFTCVIHSELDEEPVVVDLAGVEILVEVTEGRATQLGGQPFPW